MKSKYEKAYTRAVDKGLFLAGNMYLNGWGVEICSVEKDDAKEFYILRLFHNFSRVRKSANILITRDEFRSSIQEDDPYNQIAETKRALALFHICTIY